MSTTKTVKVQKNKVLTYSINKTGFQTVNKSIVVTDNVKITENLVSQSGSPIQQLGDRLFGISSYVCDFTPSGTYDVDSLKYVSGKQTTGNGLTNIQVVKSLWLAQIETALSVETPRGTSNTFTFTYNGSTWDLTGATTVSGISTQDLNDVYGISFTGTAINGDVITVVETQYNKFAVYILDSNYRSNQMWTTTFIKKLDLPVQYENNPQNCLESATFVFDYMIKNNNISDYPLINTVKNFGNFILPNGLKINALIPNGAELQVIYNNRVTLDSFDPIIQSGSTSYNLTNWNFSANCCSSCVECNKNDMWVLKNNNNTAQWYTYSNGKGVELGCCPIFEVPVM